MGFTFLRQLGLESTVVFGLFEEELSFANVCYVDALFNVC